VYYGNSLRVHMNNSYLIYLHYHTDSKPQSEYWFIISSAPINEKQFDVIPAQQLLKSILTTSGNSNNYKIEILIALPGKLCGIFLFCNYFTGWNLAVNTCFQFCGAQFIS